MIGGGAPPLGTLEFSLFGTGFGESICVHLGNGEWIIVDSCTSAKNGVPLPLNYLKGIGVDCATAVKLIALSHWDADHIEGAAQIFDACPNAQLAFSQALTTQEFGELIAGYGKPGLVSDAAVSRLREFARLIEIRQQRKAAGAPAPVHVSEGQVLYLNGAIRIQALAPSPRTIERSVETLALWLPDNVMNAALRPIPQHRNDFTLVIWVCCGERSALLGGDLENTNDAQTGWNAAANSPLVQIAQRAGFYKVAHHGSPNGDHPDVWAKLVGDNSAVCAVTAFNRGKKKRPAPDDVVRLRGRTSHLYATTMPNTQPTARQPVVDKLMGEATRSRQALTRSPGQIRVRWADGGIPSVEVGGSAALL